MLKSINHIGIAVKDLDAALDIYKKLFEIEDVHYETVESQKVKVASFYVGEVRLELTAPTDETSPIAKHIEKRGEGVQHIAFESDAIQTDLDDFKSKGVKLINETAQPGAHDMLIAFLHPKSTGGVLMEVCQEK